MRFIFYGSISSTAQIAELVTYVTRRDPIHENDILCFGRVILQISTRSPTAKFGITIFATALWAVMDLLRRSATRIAPSLCIMFSSFCTFWTLLTWLAFSRSILYTAFICAHSGMTYFTVPRGWMPVRICHEELVVPSGCSQSSFFCSNQYGRKSVHYSRPIAWNQLQFTKHWLQSG